MLPPFLRLKIVVFPPIVMYVDADLLIELCCYIPIGPDDILSCMNR